MIIKTIENSGLFTLVSETSEQTIYTNITRGVVAILNDYRDEDYGFDWAQMYFDRGGDKYYSAGAYAESDLVQHVFPVMKNDVAWSRYVTGDQDITNYVNERR